MRFLLAVFSLFSLSLQGASDQVYTKQLAEGVTVTVQVVSGMWGPKLELTTSIQAEGKHSILSSDPHNPYNNVPQVGLKLYQALVVKHFKAPVKVYLSGRMINAHEENMFFEVDGIDFLKKNISTVDRSGSFQNEGELMIFTFSKTFFIKTFGPSRARDDQGDLISAYEQSKIYIGALLKNFIEDGFLPMKEQE